MNGWENTTTNSYIRNVRAIHLQVFGKNLLRPSIDRGGDDEGIPEGQPVSTKILALIQFITGRRAAAAVEAFLQLGQGFFLARK